MKLASLLVLIVLSCTFISCTETAPQVSGITYLGGQIINPEDSHVVLSQGTKIIDSTMLDQNGKFLFAIDSLKAGIYRFSNDEYQNVYLEPGDSIMLRVNGISFDESLSYSGRGAPINNFLINMYLHNEKENASMTRFYQLPPQLFVKALDSMQTLREKMLSKFVKKHEPSPAMQSIAEASVYFDNYTRKESYPFNHYGKDKISLINNLPKDFYRFRESVNLNNATLAYHNPYLRYIIRFLDHNAYLSYCDQSPYNTLSYLHNKHEIELIDSLITNKDIKDRLLGRVARIFIANSNDRNETAAIYQLFLRKAEGQAVRNRISQHYETNKRLEAGNRIPDQFVVASDKRVVTLSSIITKPTVLYFWSHNNHDYTTKIHKKVEELKSKFPEYNFIGLNTQGNMDTWVRLLKNHKFDPLFQYQFTDISDARAKLVLNAPNKTIVLNKKGIILNSHANLFNMGFEQELKHYISNR